MTADETAHKELKEELGVDTKLIFMFKQLYKGSQETHFTYWYIGKYNGESMTLQTEEVEGTALLNKEEVEELREKGEIL